MQRGVKLLSVSLTLLCSVPGSARLCFSVLIQKPLCTPITLHRLTTGTKMSLMKSLGDNSSRCRLSASIHLRAPSPLWFLSSSVALGGIWDSAVAVYFSKKLKIKCLSCVDETQVSCCVTCTCCHHSLWHRRVLWLSDLFADKCYFISAPALFVSSCTPSRFSLLVYLIKYCDSVLCSDVNSMANYFFMMY